MDKMWAGRFEKALDKQADDFNSSIHFDSKMYKQDIRGSLEHALMLCSCGILNQTEYEKITEGLNSILDDLTQKNLLILKYLNMKVTIWYLVICIVQI